MDQDFRNFANCSNITEANIRAMNWIRVSIAASGFIIVTTIFIIVMVRREFKTVIERLFIYLLISTLMRQASLVSMVEHQFKHQAMDEVCSFLGAMDLYTSFLVMFFSASSVVYLLSRAVQYKPFYQRSRVYVEITLVFLALVLPLLLSHGLIFTNLYGLSVAWCWLKAYNNDCTHTSTLKKVLGGYTLLLGTGIFSVFLMVVVVVVYCKIARKVKKAVFFLKQATILITCLMLHVLLLIFSTLVNAVALVNQKYIVGCTYAVVMALNDLIYPLGFLAFLKYQGLATLIQSKQRRAQYMRIAKSHTNATVPLSDRVSANSTTVPFTFPFTGEFTDI